ncbi:MAG: hypothetical protein QNK40_06640 [Desulfobacterales bacterium]|nr:hypothetical protein [Desulfobacterales bacterium]
MMIRKSILILIDKEKKAQKKNRFNLKFYQGRIPVEKIDILSTNLLAEAMAKAPEHIYLVDTVHIPENSPLISMRNFVGLIRDIIQTFKPKI